MTTKNSKDNNDLHLFREAMQDVKPIQHNRVVHHKKPQTGRRNASTGAQHKPDLDDRHYSTGAVTDCDIILGFERPGLQKSVMKKLRQGKMLVEDSLDLHGYSAEQARTALIEFMQYCQQQQLKVVCIVHGKGFGSSDRKPVIKPLVNQWLQQTDQVLGFCSAQPKDGGSGAVYVLLRRDKSS
ncbi:MAG: Smr/MutS family endonuclease [Gammaproteobacteria bacterium]|nr:Smr/MutS family endonuclease [Gammaproteobacteria bacterium]